jgi:hypothetical protein
VGQVTISSGTGGRLAASLAASCGQSGSRVERLLDLPVEDLELEETAVQGVAQKATGLLVPAQPVRGDRTARSPHARPGLVMPQLCDKGEQALVVVCAHQVPGPGWVAAPATSRSR